MEGEGWEGEGWGGERQGMSVYDVRGCLWCVYLLSDCSCSSSGFECQSSARTPHTSCMGIQGASVFDFLLYFVIKANKQMERWTILRSHARS